MFIFPPRPVSRIHPDTLDQYQKEPWVGQYKFNGTRNVISIVRDKGLVDCYERFGEEHKQWKMSNDVKDQLLSLNFGNFNTIVLDSELMHNKTTDPFYKNRIVLYDVLYTDRYLLRGPSCLERLAMLDDFCGNPRTKEDRHGLARVVSENVWFLETFDHTQLVQEYERHIDKKEIEGLMLKKGNASIDSLGKTYYETDALLRCRKSHKNYNF